MVLSIEGFIL